MIKTFSLLTKNNAGASGAGGGARIGGHPGSARDADQRQGQFQISGVWAVKGEIRGQQRREMWSHGPWTMSLWNTEKMKMKTQINGDVPGETKKGEHNDKP